jgi:hypothetical protein
MLGTTGAFLVTIINSISFEIIVSFKISVMQGERKIATDHHLLRVASVKSLASLLSNVAGLFAHEFIVHASS